VIHVGVCSWTEKTLLQSGEFYPRNVRTAEGRLQFYASRFDTVEVDSTYYAIPAKNNSFLWAQRTPRSFIFHIKVFGTLTGHGIDPRALPPDIRSELSEKDRTQKQIFVKEPALLRDIAEKFLEALYPLMSAGKLGVMVFQFPPWFTYKSENLDIILKHKAMIGRNRMAVEFRHGSWYAQDVRDKVFHFLRKNQIVHVVADEPQFGSSVTVPFVPQTTADIAYYRLHGRNKDTWLKKDAETSLRYSYLYSDRELKEFVPHIQTSAKQAQETFVMFNNCHRARAVRNAATIKMMLKGGEGYKGGNRQ
jgi:uncharacterized protein YecE (DUF72 family)